MRKVINGMKEPRCKSTLKEGDKIMFVNGSYKGVTGIISILKWNYICKPEPVGLCILTNGDIGIIENTLDWEFA